MWAIELLEIEEKRLLKNRSFLHPISMAGSIEMVDGQIEGVRWALKVLKMAMGRAGETVTLPKGGQ